MRAPNSIDILICKGSPQRLKKYYKHCLLHTYYTLYTLFIAYNDNIHKTDIMTKNFQAILKCARKRREDHESHYYRTIATIDIMDCVRGR